MKKLICLRKLFPVTISLCLFFLVPALAFAQVPPNDLCASAITLTSGITCSNTVGTENNATVTGGDPNSSPCVVATVKYDVWYKFVAQSTNPIITLSSVGINFLNPKIQIFSGVCGGLTAVSCGASPLTAAGLTIGTTYYIRVFSTNNPIPATLGGFSICVTDQVLSKIDYGKSYINITKGLNGGTVDPGDTLEIRATFVVSSNTVDSVAFFDTLFNTKGLRLIPNSLALRTNEGKVYKSFLDPYNDNDAGWSIPTGSDTLIHINMGYGATASQYARGKLRNTSKPSNFGATCIIMATYRVVVYAGYNTKINFAGGAFSFRDTATGLSRAVGFNSDSLIVYQSPGLCPNAISVVNAIGIESNGTFGVPSGINFARNRAPSPYTSYTYATFIPAGGPQDYYYGITNNTSAQFTTVTTWAKPDLSSPAYRVFGQWDIMGDHTGAANTAKGNPPCDTSKAVSATNPCGYMLVLNSAYRTDVAFQYTVANLCPNTNYEIAAWIKNMCYKCSCDSNGVTPATAGYIPSGVGDSAGVQPNIAFEVNGMDYYTTGNIRYTGLTQTASDTTNTWYKKGFTYLTGPGQTSFTLTLRNNAPGGGGNDWAIDDIGVATCLPNMKYSPSKNPIVCMYNPMIVRDTVTSYFPNYTFYKWQRSIDNGVTWTDESAPGSSGTATVSPTPPAPGPYQYVASYTIPAIQTAPADSGNLYRLMVGTTAPNLSNANCQATDGTSQINLKIIDCGVVLKTDLLSFNGKLVNDLANLFWTTSKEDEPINYNIERSTDGTNFSIVGSVSGNNKSTVPVNHYSFIDPLPVKGTVQYRIVMINRAQREKRSNVIQLSKNEMPDFALENVINPFASQLEFNVVSSKNTSIDVQLIDAYGKIVKQYSYMVYAGVNNLSLKETTRLSSGMYIFRIVHNEKIIYRNVLKL